MNLIERLEKEALLFMEKRKKVEDRLIKDAIKIVDNLEKDIINQFRMQEGISLSFLIYFINSEILPIINRYKEEYGLLMDDAINSTYQIGIQNGQKLLNLIEQNNNVLPEIQGSSYEEVAVALLIYVNSLIENLYGDLANNINKDATSIYITNKKQNNFIADRDINTDDSTINTVLSGAIIGKYINSTFNNIRNRAKLIARNEVNRALNHGHIMHYMENGNKYVKWIEVRDNRLCAHCMAAASGGPNNDGVYEISSVNPPPLHPNCRCIIIPYNPLWEQIYIW